LLDEQGEEVQNTQEPHLGVCCVCEKRRNGHVCVECWKFVCWRHNWAKSCFAVCDKCIAAERTAGRGEECEPRTLAEE